jgi:hypothetical protein
VKETIASGALDTVNTSLGLANDLLGTLNDATS